MDIAGILLCAGFGTRLKPLTDEVPKPAIPFLSRPMVWYAMNALKNAGITTLAANVHHLPDVMTRVLGECAQDLEIPQIATYREREILGTGGGARACMELMPPAQNYVIYHGDVLCGADIAKALQNHLYTNADVTLVVAPRPESSKLGMVGIDENHRICRIRDWYRPNANQSPFQPGFDNNPLTPCCFTGIHIIRREVLETLALEQNSCLVTELYPKMMAQDLAIRGFLTKAFFADIGTPETYLDAQKAILSNPENLPGATVYPFVSKDSGMDGPTIIPPVSIAPGIKLHTGTTIGPNVCLSGHLEIKCGETLAETMRFDQYRLPERQP